MQGRTTSRLAWFCGSLSQPAKELSSQTSHRPHETRDAGLPASMLQTVVSNNKDAMNILFEAALREESHHTTGQDRAADRAPRVHRHWGDALRVWNACRFVKMGWFSAHEAVALVDLWALEDSRLPSKRLADYDPVSLPTCTRSPRS